MFVFLAIIIFMNIFIETFGKCSVEVHYACLLERDHIFRFGIFQLGLEFLPRKLMILGDLLGFWRDFFI